MLASTAVVLVLAAALLGWVAAREGGQLVRPRGNTSLAQARLFRGYPLYFAGQTVAGNQLEAVVRIDRTSPARYTEFRFLYGACRLPAGEGGCGPPLVIMVWPACYRYETRYSIRPDERTVSRDVPARRSRKSRRLELYPARTTIVINGHGLKSAAQLLAVARQLRGVNVPLRRTASLPARPHHAGHTIRCP